MVNSWTKKQCIESLITFYKENNRIPQANDFRSNSDKRFPSCATIQKKFGSWSKGIAAAGLIPFNRNIWSKEIIINKIQEFYRINNRLPKQSEFQQNIDYPNFSTVQNYFGTWNKAIEASGFNLNTYCIWNIKTIIECIRKFQNENQRIPNARDFKNNPNYPGKTTVASYFGTWNAAIEAAGFIPLINSGYGIPTIAKDGITYLSQAEAYFVDNYLYNKYNYVYEVEYGNGWYYDFYIAEYDIFIELTGGLRPERILQKIQFNKEQKINCLIIKTEEMYKNNFNLEERIRQ